MLLNNQMIRDKISPNYNRKILKDSEKILITIKKIFFY